MYHWKKWNWSNLDGARNVFVRCLYSWWVSLILCSCISQLYIALCMRRVFLFCWRWWRLCDTFIYIPVSFGLVSYNPNFIVRHIHTHTMYSSACVGDCPMKHSSPYPPVLKPNNQTYPTQLCTMMHYLNPNSSAYYRSNYVSVGIMNLDLRTWQVHNLNGLGNN